MAKVVLNSKHNLMFLIFNVFTVKKGYTSFRQIRILFTEKKGFTSSRQGRRVLCNKLNNRVERQITFRTKYFYKSFKTYLWQGNLNYQNTRERWVLKLVIHLKTLVFFLLYFVFRKWLYLEISQKSGYTCVGYTPDFLKMVTIPNLAIQQKKWLYITWLYFVNGYTFVFPHRNWQHASKEI